MEPLEPRLLLSSVLGVGQVALFDFDGGGNDAILINSGTTDLEYDVTGGNGLAVDLVGDGGAFITNTWVEVDDTNPLADYLLDSAMVGGQVVHDSVTYDPIAGENSVQARSVGFLQVTTGNLSLLDVQELNASTVLVTPGDVGTVVAEIITNASYLQAQNIELLQAETLDGDSFLLTADDFDKMDVGRMESATVIVGGGMVELVIDNLVGSQNSTNVIVGDGVESIRAGTITGGQDGSSLYVAVTGGVDYLKARRITGGVDSLLDISIRGGLDRLCAGVMSGGYATEGNEASATLNVTGNIDKWCSRTIIGGRGSGYAQLTVNVGALYGQGGELLEPGDVRCLKANRILGGEVDPNGEAKLQINIKHDLYTLCVGDIIGSNEPVPTYDPSVNIIVGNDIHRLYARRITGGLAMGVNALSYVRIHAGHDIKLLVANEISGGRTTNGGYSYVEILAEHDIKTLKAGTIIGSRNRRRRVDPAVQIHAYNDLVRFYACRIVAGDDGVVNILAGMDGEGNVFGELNDQGEFEAGSIGCLITRYIDGDDGQVNIAAGGDIHYMRVCRISSGNDGEVNVSSGGSMTVDVWRVYSWRDYDNGQLVDTGVEFDAGGVVNDVRGRISSRLIEENLLAAPPALGDSIDFVTDPLDLPVV